jgi:large subunit ribosomal protein L10
MTREEKAVVITQLKDRLQDSSFLYLADSSAMTVAEVNDFRRVCYQEGIDMQVVKNTLAVKAIDQLENKADFENLLPLFKGTTAFLFTQTANAPARVMKQFRKKNKKPILKGAYIDTDIYVGDDQMDLLAALKSKEELLGEVIGLLQSPMKTVVSALQSSGGNLVSGLLKALEERDESPSEN